MVSDENHIRNTIDTIDWCNGEIKQLRYVFSTQESEIEQELQKAKDELGIVLREENTKKCLFV